MRRNLAMMSFIPRIIFILAVFAGALPCFAEYDPFVVLAPAWLKKTMAEPLGSIAKDADAVTIADYEFDKVNRDGSVEREVRKTIKILTKGGAKYAIARVDYNKKSDDLGDLCAWIVLPCGEVRRFGDKDFYCQENFKHVIYTELWFKKLDKSGEVIPGSVFAWSYTLHKRTCFPQLSWDFASKTPSLKSTISVMIPKDWKITVTPINNPQYTSRTEPILSWFTSSDDPDKVIYTWEAVDQQPIKIEPYSERKNLDPSIGINIYPTDADKTSAGLETFDDWQSVAAYVARANDNAAHPDAAIKAKVGELTKDCDTSWKKVQAVCSFVQTVNYSSVNKNLSKGGGYSPSPASEVFSNNYGDNKGKTALLRAMLACLGIQSYSVVCEWSDKSDVSPEWPTASAFNHCITAIVPQDGWEAGSIAEHPQFGRLLLFDPTNSFVPVGHFCSDFGNEVYLVGSAGCKELAKFPFQDAFSQFNVVASLDPSGCLKGTCKRLFKGDFASKVHLIYKEKKASDYEVGLVEDLRQQTRAMKIVKWNVDDRFDDNEFGIDISFEAPDYVRRIGASKMLVKAFVDSAPLTVPEKPENGVRKTSFLVPEGNEEAHSEITIPEGFVVGELPKDISVKEEFGELEMHCVAEGDLVKVSVKKTQTGKLMPPEAYERFMNFYRARNKAFAATIVIAKK